MGLLFSRHFPIDDGQHRNNHDQRTDTTGEDGDTHRHPERTLGDNHGHHTNGSCRRGILILNKSATFIIL